MQSAIWLQHFRQSVRPSVRPSVAYAGIAPKLQLNVSRSPQRHHSTSRLFLELTILRNSARAPTAELNTGGIQKSRIFGPISRKWWKMELSYRPPSWNFKTTMISLERVVRSTSCLFFGAYCQHWANHIVYRFLFIFRFVLRPTWMKRVMLKTLTSYDFFIVFLPVFMRDSFILADRTNGRVYAITLCPSDCLSSVTNVLWLNGASYRKKLLRSK